MNTLRSLTLFFVLCQAFNPALGQVQEAWVARYHGFSGAQEVAAALALDSADNLYVTGTTSGRYATLKYDANGNRLWVAHVDNGGSAIAVGLGLDATDNVHVVGTAGTVKYAPDGQQLWLAPLAVGVAIAVEPGGSVYVINPSASYGPSADFLTSKYDQNGNRLWQARYDGPISGEDIPVAIARDGAGNIYVCGRSAEFGSDYAIVKYNPNGTQLWVARYSGAPTGNYDWPAAMAIDAANNVYITGTAGSSACGDGTSDFATVKYDPGGRMLWVARYGSMPAWGDMATAIAVDSLGNAYVAGEAPTGHSGLKDFVIVKYDSDGRQQWAGRYSSGSVKGLGLDTQGNVYVSGGTSGGYSVYTTLQLDPDGNRLWSIAYSGLHTNAANSLSAMFVDTNGDVYVTGQSDISYWTEDEFATVKYTHAPVPGAPRILSPPANQVLVPGTSAALGVVATGDPPLSYQWFRNGAPMSQKTNATLEISNVGFVDHGWYWVEVCNSLGIAVTPEARLIVQTAPSFTSQPGRQQVLPGATATFSANANGRNLSYEWRFNRLALPGATNCLLMLTNAQISQSGDYTLVVSNALGAVTSVVATLSVGIPAILGQPRSQSVVSGTNVTLAVAAEGSAPLGFQWYFQAVPLPTATGTILALSNVVAINSGAYHVVITNAYGGITSMVATVTVHPAVPQLDGWHRRSPAAGTRDFLNAVAHGNGNFVAVGALGTILTSPDGINWTNRSPVESNQLRGVAYGESGFGAVGISLMGPVHTKILTSRDAATWTAQIVQTNTVLKAIAYGNGNYVAIGNSGNKGVILTSRDALNWTSSISGNSDRLNAITYGASRFVIAAMTSTPTILSSTDGLAWVRHSLQGSASPEAIAYGHGVFVAAGSTTVWTSSDSAMWTHSPGPPSWSPLAIASGYGYFVAVSYFGRLHTSSDGLAWVQRPSGTSRNLAGIAFGNNSFVAVGGDDDPYEAVIVQSGVFTPIHLQIRQHPSDPHVELTLTGETGRTYRVQAATALPAANWTEVTSLTLTGTTAILSDTLTTNFPQRFYRAVWP